ncbi:Chlorophyll A-B binding protein [Cynara cardunculus var. scolymus]|uniref:Chlorophyll A-B binding protein n=1 Tax=Cynara cardunculus var. scolymus TaxID=59895 RepID=A0A124SBT9_CYNCS|nr:Chlorophyll A-B binding protein [Cynara cardunculus var. scolymus]
MAATSVFMATPFTRLSATQLPSFNKNSVFSVRCMSSQLPNDAETNSKTPPPPLATPPPPPAPKVSTKFTDVLAFSGPAPERINGRLAMIGFVATMAVELSSGQDVFTQISNGGVTVFVVTSVVLSVASLVPLLKGVSVQSKSKGIMTSDAELWNGRVAETPLNIEANDVQWRRIDGGYIRCRHKMLCLYLWWRNDEVSWKNRYRIHEL